MKPLRLPNHLGYASGDAANNLAFSMSSMFLLISYTDVVGISAAAVGSLFLLVPLWDAFADVFAGLPADRPSTRWGRSSAVSDVAAAAPAPSAGAPR